MKKLSREQKKIIYVALVVLAFFILFWVIIYLPQSRRLIDIKNRLIGTEGEISQINKIAEGKPMQEAIVELNLKLSRVVAMLPSKEEDIIKVLSEEAKKLKIDIPVMDPEDAAESLAVQIPGLRIKELAISMKLVCEYKALGQYLEILRNKLPFLVKVRQLTINGVGEGNLNLNVDLKISAYLSEQG